VSVLNSTVSPATLACWIDFNRDGDFLETGERASAAVNNSTLQQTINLTFTGFAAPTAGVSYLRCRLASSASEVAAPTGLASSGEVEDFQVTIGTALDYGDAPDTGAGTAQGNYNTLATDSGPSHVIVSGLQLGQVAPDADNGTLENGSATMDDATQVVAGVNDEDGVTTLPIITTASTSVQLQVSALNTTGSPATLACWIDFNHNGSFQQDAGEKASTTVVSQSGQQMINLTFTGFAALSVSDIYLRCRIANAATEVALPTGAANTGEVEDYFLRINTPLAVTLASFTADATGDGVLLAWETVSEQDNAGFNLYRSAAADQPGALVAFVPAQAPGSPEGASYTWQDTDVAPGNTYFYWLEDVALDGTRTLHGPASATYAPDNIKPAAPTAVRMQGLTAVPAASALPWAGALVAALGGAAFVLRRRR
jgi:hypothetical protein